ncbi:MAG: DUF969 domain-containing protein [Clostridium sp.]|uniref:DUF969 domain-containing protein n=1 Tax=Clostridium sp. TaxID=1506 RepID=UPI003070C6E2
MIKLIGILIVVVGFTLKMNSIAIVLVSALVTGLVGGLAIPEIFEILGASFVDNRTICIFIIIMLVTGTLERNGLQEVVANAISKIKRASSGLVIASYGVMRTILGAFDINVGGAAGFVRPVVVPMAEGAIKAKYGEVNEEHLEEVKGMSAAMENIAWFFGQVLFVGGSGALLVQSTLKDLGYEVNLLEMAKVEIPVAIAAIALASVYFILKDKKIAKKCYKDTKEK